MSLFNLTDGPAFPPFFDFEPSPSFGSSKNFRQSSSPPASLSTGSSSESDSDRVSAGSLALFFDLVDFGLGGLVPSSSTHQELSSLDSVGNVVTCSKRERRFWRTCREECERRRGLARTKHRDQVVSRNCTYWASRIKNHRISSWTSNQVSRKSVRTCMSSRPSLVCFCEAISGRGRGRGDGGARRRKDIIFLKNGT